MAVYEKPIILLDENIPEGVYASSGSSGAGCQSVYMRGVFQRNTRYENIKDPSNDSDLKHTLIERGCEGCPYNWGRCAVNDPNAQPGQDGRPGWEKAGYKDTDVYSIWS